MVHAVVVVLLLLCMLSGLDTGTLALKDVNELLTEQYNGACAESCVDARPCDMWAHTSIGTCTAPM